MVKAAPDPQQRRMARISYASAFSAAVLALTGWLIFHESPTPVAERRALEQASLLWVCEKNPNHRFVARGRFEPRPCRECDGQCFIQLRFRCPVHEVEFDALVQFERAASAGAELGTPDERIVRYRYVDRGDWHDTDGSVPCPVAGCTAQPTQVRTAWSDHHALNKRP
jgi:hypothetical protein